MIVIEFILNKNYETLSLLRDRLISQILHLIMAKIIPKLNLSQKMTTFLFKLAMLPIKKICEADLY